MDGNKQKFFKKRPYPQFKQKGANKKGRSNFSHEQSSATSHAVDTVYRILCPSRKIGGVIGKGGSIVKALREETQAKITVSDSVSGSDERIIIVYSSPNEIAKKQNNDEASAEENEEGSLHPHCAAQDALLKVHDRIAEEELFGGTTFDDDNDSSIVTARLLVPNNMVGCLLGKGGDVIQRLRSETGASVRILPPEHLPSCATSTDELVQISGKPNVTKRALFEVSTLLHQNPRKEKPPSGHPMPFGAQGNHPLGAPMIDTMLQPANPMWPHRNSASRGVPPMPWMGGYGNHPSGYEPDGFRGPPRHDIEPPAEFSMKILCPVGKIGSVIGKGGFNVKQLQQETGASIHVQDASTKPDERVIRVYAVEALWNPRSETIEAILQLQNKTSELSEKGTISTRLLVPSSKVGCILGQGGHIINEMRRRTKADIRVYSKDDKPKCAAEDEELVQISGNFEVVIDALAEIASRLRVRTLRDANAGSEPPPIHPAQGFGPAGSLAGRELPPSSAMGAGNIGSLDPLKVGRARAKRLDFQSGGSDYDYEVEIHGQSEHLNPVHTVRRDYMTSSGQNMTHQQGSYHQSTNTHQGLYHHMNVEQIPYQTNAHQSPYDINIHPRSYVNTMQSTYQNIKTDVQQGAYQNVSTQQGAYQY